MAVPEVPEGGKFRVLVVEDDSSIARLILALLSKAGFECLYAPDGQAGLSRFREADPHLVITDIMMPGMNGQELCAEIRKTSEVPIIMMTAADSEESQLKGFKMGADDYIPKPFNPTLLMARVMANLRRVYRYDAQEHKPEPTAAAQSFVRRDWLTCNSCGYIGPRTKFEDRGTSGQPTLVCPNCRDTNITFSVV